MYKSILLIFVVIAVNAPVSAEDLLEEGFENGTIPPFGWVLDTTVTTHTWQIENRPAYVHSGDYSCAVPYQNNYEQDERLTAMAVNCVGYSSPTLKFWWYGSTYFSQFANLYILVSGDDVTYDLLWEIPYRPSGSGSHIWTLQELSLEDYGGGATVYIRFRYSGQSGDWVFIDDVQVSGDTSITSSSLGKVKAAFK